MLPVNCRFLRGLFVFKIRPEVETGWCEDVIRFGCPRGKVSPEMMSDVRHRDC